MVDNSDLLGDKPGALRNVSGSSITAPLLLAAATLMVIFLYYSHEYFHYVPYADDPAVFGASAGSPANWFVKGYSNYFIVYPEWTEPYTDFLRPGASAIVRSDQALFGHQYEFYFLAFYLAQFVLVLLVLKLAQAMQASQKALLLLAFLLAINPGFFNFGITAVAGQFDFWCGFFAIAAFFCLTRKGYIFAVILLACAVFTKETALYAPIGASITMVYAGRRKLAAVMLLPILAWVGVRKFIFSGTASGLYMVSLRSPITILLGIIKGLLVWPTGLVPFMAIKNILIRHDLLHDCPYLMLIAINIVFWLLLVSLGIKFFSAGRRVPFSPLMIFVWLCGALGFCVLVAPELRFGGSVYPLELLFLVVAASVLPISRLRSFCTAALYLLLPLFLWSMHAAAPLKTSAKARISMHQLNDMLKRYGTDAHTVYVVSSAPSFSSPEYLARLANIPGKIVILNEFDGCLTGPGGSVSMTQKGASDMDIVVQIPKCAHFLFDGDPGLSSVLAQGIGNGMLKRGDFAVYNFPFGRITGHAIRDVHVLDLDFNDRLNLSLKKYDPENSILLYYDWTTGNYDCAGKLCAISH